MTRSLDPIPYLRRSWFVRHFLAWASLFALVSSLQPIRWYTTLVVGAVTAVAWELVESRAEEMYGIEPEVWWDRWVLDPIADLSGSFAGWGIGILIRQLISGWL